MSGAVARGSIAKTKRARAKHTVAVTTRLTEITERGTAGMSVLLGKRIPTIDPRFHAKMQRIADGQAHVGFYLWHFKSLARCEDILDWCLKNRVTGKEFLLFSRFYCGGSILETAKEILRRIDKSETTAPIVLGRDYRIE